MHAISITPYPATGYAASDGSVFYGELSFAGLALLVMGGRTATGNRERIAFVSRTYLSYALEALTAFLFVFVLAVTSTCKKKKAGRLRPYCAYAFVTCRIR